GSELQVEADQPAQDVRRHVVVAPLPRGTVLRVVDADVAHAIEETLDGDAALRAREWRAGARVDTVPECKVLPGVGPLDLDLGRVAELSRVSVCCTVDHHQVRAGRYVDAADG